MQPVVRALRFEQATGLYIIASTMLGEVDGEAMPGLRVGSIPYLLSLGRRDVAAYRQHMDGLLHVLGSYDTADAPGADDNFTP